MFLLGGLVYVLFLTQTTHPVFAQPLNLSSLPLCGKEGRPVSTTIANAEYLFFVGDNTNKFTPT